MCLDLQLDDDRVKDMALAEIEKNPRSNGRSLADYPPMPLPNDTMLCNTDNVLMSEELNYDREFLRTQHSQLFSSLTSGQRNIYDMIIDAVNRSEGGVFFVNGFGGSGKTFVWNTLTAELRGWGEIVLTGGRTTHSRFVIPLDSTESSTCNIMQCSDHANLLLHTKLIIWDEAPMAHRYYFEALDMSLRDIIGYHNPECYKKPFGGKVIVFGGDFRQILPVIPKCFHQDILLSSLNSSYIWDSCKLLTLTKNMRLCSGSSDSENQAIYKFLEWILKIGNGLIGYVLNEEESHITILEDILIHDVQDPIDAIVKSTYPSFMDNYDKHAYIRDRAVLAPSLDDVASVNNYMLSLLPGEESTYLSSDSICTQDQEYELSNIYTTEFLNTISGSGLPYHELKLKVGAPVMLLRNIDKSMGLCNGTCLIITRLCNHVVEAVVIFGSNVDNSLLSYRLQ
ncbi:ATP-dependent DNA helicase PIF1-like [Senna tora]|uniref:ATP-dependent DNA helicase n=1 Tax=Senna tora TaxID=362788 RepID=A0A834W2Y7_9FABA|nr:ATP-dependent DNA helicase PIF1-like [Senna tora]